MLLKCFTQYFSQFGKLFSGHRTGKGVLIPIPKKGNAKECSNVVAQLYLILWDPMGYSPPGSSVHKIFQARILEWIAILFSREFSWPRYQTLVFCIAGTSFTIWATREAPKCSNYCTIVLISHASKIMLKILQVTLPQYMNWEIPDVQAGFQRGRRTRDQIANTCWIMEKAKEFQKNIYFCFVDYTKAFDGVDHNKLWKILKEMGVLDHLTCFLRNLYVDQEAAVRTRHGTTDWFQTGKGVWQGCKLSPCLSNLHAEYIMWKAGLDESQAGIKIDRGNNNLRYVYDTTPMAEIEEKLKSLLMSVREEDGKSWLETQH